MRRYFSVLVVAFLAHAACSCRNLTDEPAHEKELERLAGEWQMVYGGRGDDELSGRDLNDRTLTFAGTKGTLQVEKKIFAEFTATLNPSKKPKAIDMEETKGELKGVTSHSIYFIEDDVLVICSSASPDRRPKKFTTDDGAWLAIYKRTKPASVRNPEKHDKRSGVKDDVRSFQGMWRVVYLGSREGSIFQDDLTSHTFTFDGERYKWESKDKNEGSFKLGATQGQKTFDLRESVGIDKGNMIRGIYLLRDDLLILCHGRRQSPRPTRFSVDVETFLFVLKRQNP